MSDIIYSPIIDPLQGDRSEMERFVRIIFKHATTGFISHRAFKHKVQDGEKSEFGRYLELGNDGLKHWVWPATPITNREAVIEIAMLMVGLCANASVGVVYAPPVVTLAKSWSAK